MNHINISGKYFNEYLTIIRSTPSLFAEITRWHLEIIAEVLNSEADPERHPEMIMYRWLNIPWNIYNEIDIVYRKQISLLCAFVFADNTLGKVLVPEIIHKGVKYFGPEDSFKNISFLEWILGETALKKYQATKKEKHLDEIVYCMYRPNRKDIDVLSSNYRGDLREPLNQFSYENKAEVFFDLPKKLKTMALITMIGNRNNVIHRFDAVFADAEDRGVEDIYGWAGVIRSMANGKWSSDAEIEQEKAYNVFIAWHQNINRLQEYEDQMEEAKNK